MSKEKQKSETQAAIARRNVKVEAHSLLEQKNVHITRDDSKAPDGSPRLVAGTRLTRPSDALVTGSRNYTDRKAFIDELIATKCNCAADADKLPDVLEVIYTFNFPESCAEFRKLLSTDWWIFDTEQFTQASNKVNVNVKGFGRYVLRCPFIPCALCIGIDADAYSWTYPAVTIPASSDNTPVVRNPYQTNDTQSQLGAVTGNALVSWGVYSNLIKQFMLMSMGVRVQYDCDNVVKDQSLRTIGVRSSNLACIGTNTLVSTDADVKNINDQLANTNADYRVVLAPNADCGCSDSEVAKGAFPQQASASPNNCSTQGDGCLALDQVPLLPGMGLDIILYTLPGQEQSREDLLRQACTDSLNPTSDVDPTLVDRKFATIWLNANAITFETPGGQVTIAQFQQIPQELLTIEGTVAPFVVKARFPAWVAPATPAAVPTYAAGATIAGADVRVEVLTYTVGTNEKKIINAGRLQITFSVRGCFIRRSDLAYYFKAHAVHSVKIRKLMLESSEIRNILDAGVRNNPELFNMTADESKAGVNGLPEVARILGKTGNAKDLDADSDD